MTDNDPRSEQAGSLRNRAEEIARAKAASLPENVEALSPREIRQIFHELRVHEIELAIWRNHLLPEAPPYDSAPSS